MATTHTVVKGETLWGLAEKYLGSGTKYQQLASWNNISSPYTIYVGQVLTVSGPASSSGSGSSSTTNNSNQATITNFGLQSNTDSTLFATWTWSKDNTENYELRWYYATGDGVWFIGSDTTTEYKQATYSYPSNATRVKFQVKPVSKKHTVNNKETSYWTANWSTEKIYEVSSTPLDAPSAPSVKIENYQLTASLDNITIKADYIQFLIVKNDKNSVSIGLSKISYGHASYSYKVEAGNEYRVKCRGKKGDVFGEWSSFSSNVGTIPATPSAITTCKANSETSVYLEWSSAISAKTYEIEYATKKEYFDGSNATTKVSGIETTKYELTGLETGSEYFFRVRAVNENGESSWSAIVSVSIGKKPTAPTTWSSTTTVIAGEELTLYWVHNAIDGSSQTYAELELIVDGILKTYTIKNSTDEEEKDKTSFYTIDTSLYIEGTKIQWRVRTAGVTKEYGDWSVQRTIDVYAPPTLEMRITDADANEIDVITSFPFYLNAIPGPDTQAPLSYHVSIIAESAYETIDNIGNVKMVNTGEEVYSKYFDIKTSLLVEFTPGNINLDNNQTYTVQVTVSMDSGLTVTEETAITILWNDMIYAPNAEISIDKDSISASIRAYCEELSTKFYKVEYSDGVYVVTDETLEPSTMENVHATTGEIIFVGIDERGLEIYYGEVCFDDVGNPIVPITYEFEYSSGEYRNTSRILDASKIENVYTTTGERVYIATTDGLDYYYCQSTQTALVEGITLSVYRREYDGTFTELATGLINTNQTYITDPHPALDYARYRVVAITDSTGSVSYTDIAPYPVGEKSIVIQWDEEWRSFDTSNEDALEQPSWSGSLLKLPYNIDVSDSNSPDVSLISYIGRKRPVSYYGTHIGESASWNTDIDKKDEETIYALRRLALWMGDVYVREPSGSGYWANINVSFSQKHCDPVVPVSFSIVRVEGGV